VERPNVLLVVLDSARADALEPYGAPAGSTPVIAELAARGSALPLAYAAGCWTIPSHAALFTGMLPRANGLIRAPGGNPHGCKPVMEGHRSRLLPEVLRAAGYATAAASTNLWLTPESGFATGFDEFFAVSEARQPHLEERGLRSRLRWAFDGARASTDDGAAEAEGALLRWLDAERAAPFFCFVNLVECHSPYLPPRRFTDLGPLERLRAADDARAYLTFEAIWRICAGGLEVPADALDRMRRSYAGAVRALDDWLGRMLEALDDRGALEETLVIVTSDHGENLGEGGLISHIFSLDERLIHVPCVVAGPGAPAEDGPVSLAALPRLIAEAAGIAEHPWRPDSLPAGAAVAQFDPPVARDDPRLADFLRRWDLDAEAGDRLTQPLTAVTDGSHKLVVRGETEEHYDLEADPLELEPRAAGAVATDAGAHLRRVLDHPSVRARAGAAEPGRQPEGDELEDLERRMRMLGYM
jgi:arylsulfatase A-like enzyme